jgi:hypothetical protein
MRKKICFILFTSVAVLIPNVGRAGYDPTIGRWLSRDPLNNAELRQGANLYSYVRNDPLAKFDPLGLAPFRNSSPFSVVVGGGIGEGDGHDGPHIQVVVAPGGRVDAYHPAYAADGRGPLTDVDTVDINGDGIAAVPRGLFDPEKILGGDTGVGFTAYANPFPFSPDPIILFPDFIVLPLFNGVGLEPEVGRPLLSPIWPLFYHRQCP